MNRLPMMKYHHSPGGNAGGSVGGSPGGSSGAPPGAPPGGESTRGDRPLYREQRKSPGGGRLRLALFIFLAGGCLVGFQTTCLSHIRLFGLSPAAPSLGLLFTGAVGFRHSEKEGALAGLFLGFLADATGGSGIMLWPLYYLIAGYVFGLLGRRRLAHNLPSFLVFSAVLSALENLASAAFAAAVHGTAGMTFGTTVNLLVPRFLLTVLFAAPVYGLVWLESRPRKRHRLPR